TEAGDVTRRIAGAERDNVRRYTQAPGSDAAKHGLVALPARTGSAADPHGFSAGKRNTRCFFGKGAGDLEVTADADAAQPAAFFRGLFWVTKSLVVGGLERPLEDRRKLAAVISVSEGGRLRDFLGLDQVAPAQLGGINAGDIGGRVDDALDQIACLRASGAAVRPGG